MAKAKKLPSGSWRVLVYEHSIPEIDKTGKPLLDKNGKQKQKRIYKSFTSSDPTPAGKREVEYAAAEFAQNKNNSPALKNTMTVQKAIESYSALKSNVLSQTTLRAYKSMAKNSFKDINHLQLDELTSEILQNWINQLTEGRTPKTIRNINGFLSAVLDTYIPDFNYHISLPQKKKPNLYVPSDDNIKVLIDYFSDSDKDMLIAICMAAFGTLRRSEICALTIDDVKDRTIHINKAMVKDLKNEWIIKTTKTVSSTRIVVMPQFVIDLLPKHGRLISIYPSNITDRFSHALDKLSLPKFRFHDLRHYSASIMHAIGIPDVYIMQRGGWSSDATLKQIYRGSIEEYQKKYTEKVIDHFEGMQHEMQHKKISPLNNQETCTAGNGT